MLYYHVYIEYLNRKGEEESLLIYNLAEKRLREQIVNHYIREKPFLCLGVVIFPSEITRICIFESEKNYRELLLPNGKCPVDEDKQKYIVYCFYNNLVKGVFPVTEQFITSPPEEKKEPIKTPTELIDKKARLSELTIGLMKSATFLGLDTNWSLATCALQLQEIAVTLVAKRKKIKLDKANVERILDKKIQTLSFNDQYEAFSIQVNSSFDVKMPILTTHLRKMRAKVLHEGYNPKPEETESIASFTMGLLKRLKDIS